jgi:Zn-dependent protease with chaperone function
VTRGALRSGTDLRFAILITAVLASSVVAFGVVSTASPSLTRLHVERVAPCMTGIDARTAPIVDPLERLRGKMHLVNTCMEPSLRMQAGWVAAGLAVEVALAGLLFALHPWWLRRRRRMVPLGPDDNADVLDDLDTLAREAGLARPVREADPARPSEADPSRPGGAAGRDGLPQWLVAPYAATHGGQAFGLRGRRQVCLDVGLLVRFDTDRAGFRAVVRHELAHLHNRDVGRTYLTIAIWWSFVATAMVPFVALSLHPELLRHPWDVASPKDPVESAYRAVALIALVTVVYLVRNAVLRTREVHADRVAAGWDRPDGALMRVVQALPWPPEHGTRPTRPDRFPRHRWSGAAARRWTGSAVRRWTAPAARRWAHLGPHPRPADRVAAIGDPGLLDRAGAWDMAGLGMVAGLALCNVSLFVGNLAGAAVIIGLGLVALPVGMVLAGLLAGAVRRDAAGGGHGMWLPVALTAGFTIGGSLSLLAADTGLTGPASGWWEFLAGVAVLLVGTMLVAFWVRSASTSDRTDTDADTPAGAQTGADVGAQTGAGSRWWSWTVTAVAVTVSGPLFACWHLSTFGTDSRLGTLPEAMLPVAGWAIGWYSTVTGLVSLPMFYLPLNDVRHSPIAPVAVVLLWTAPVALRLIRRRTAGRSGGTQNGGARDGGARDGTDGPLSGIRRAVLVGGMAGLVVVAVGVALPFGAAALVPLDVRLAPAVTGGSPMAFSVVYEHVFLAVAALGMAGAAAVTAAGAARLRPVLVPLTVTVAAVPATAAVYATWAVSSCIDMIGPGRGVPCGPRLLAPDGFLSAYLQTVLTWGVVAALPAAALGAAAGALRRRWRPAAVRVRPVRPGGPLAATGLGLLASLVLAGAAHRVPADVAFWTPTPPPQIPDPVVAGPVTPIDPCVIGTWRETPARYEDVVGGVRADFVRVGAVQEFGADGSFALDFGDGVVASATVDGHRVQLVRSGRITARFSTVDGTIRYANPAVARPGAQSLSIDGVLRRSDPLDPAMADDRYTCSGDALHESRTGVPDPLGPYDIALRRR